MFEFRVVGGQVARAQSAVGVRDYRAVSMRRSVLSVKLLLEESGATGQERLADDFC
jgi:hypothetical protein